MKKLFDGKFLLIVVLSLLVLIGIVVGTIYLFDDSDDFFIESGYVLNPVSEKVERYFFDKDTEYRTNLSSMIEFKDTDKKDVAVLKDSFVHYMDGSISFLKNGAILDLDSVNGKGTVLFYNINNKLMLSRIGNKYIIKNNDKDIELSNFMGRINDDKYIVSGNVKAKIPGNEALISGDYFEIVYVDKGIVNIENKDVKYQVAADETILYVGNLVIDLGDKKISLNDVDMMSITEITIDGDENIEIIPKKEEDKDKDKPSNNNSTGTGDNSGNSTENNNGNQGGDSSSNSGGERIDDVIVALKEASVGSTSVSVTFDIINATEEDHFMLKVINLDTGRTVDMLASVIQDEEIMVNLLSPKTKYLFTVVNEKDQGKYFQKIFETNDFGISLERIYSTASELGYRVKVDKDTDITNAKVSLYKFNEETHQNEIVKASYYDGATGEEKYIEKVVWLNEIDTSSEIIFDGLDSNTIYTVVMDDFSLESANFKDIYNITITSMTLKKSPSFSEMKADRDMTSGSFKLSLGKIIDDDNAITKYTYLVYEQENPERTIIDPIVKTNASPIEIKIGDGENELRNDTNYFYQVVIEYFDNEKYVEYMTSDTINFVMGSDPYVTVVPKNDLISYNTIGATLYLTDNSCLVSMPNREKCVSDNSSTVVTVKKNTVGGEVIVFSKIVDFDIVDGDIKYDLFVDGLQEGTSYSIEVSAILNNDMDGKRVEIMHTDESKRIISTKTLSSFMAIYPAEDKLLSSANHVINQRVKLESSKENTGTLSPEETVKNIKKVVIDLYEGNQSGNITSSQPLVAPKVFINNDTVNLKEMFYDNYYEITTDETFGLDIDTLRSLGSDGKLSSEYTIKIRAYYDMDEVNEVKIENNTLVYSILESLLLENVEEPLIITKPITNEGSGYLFDKLRDKGTVVGYSINAVYDRKGLVNNNLTPEKINIYVYDKDHKRVKFYIRNNNKLELVDKITESVKELGIGNYVNEIYMDYGIEYGQESSVMIRGNSYYIGYEIEVNSESGTILYPSNKNMDAPSDYGVYELVDSSLKESPNIKMYVAKSTEDTITYRYEIFDPDKAMYRENNNDKYGLYYTINNGLEKKVEIDEVDNYTYSGDVILSGLKNGDVYNLYYKKNVLNTGDIENDIVNYYDGENNGLRIFDGYYDISIDKYNFSYKIINNPLTDNKVIIKIMAVDEMLERIVSYKIKFTDLKGNILEKELWQLSDCGDGDTDRCFAVDYMELKNAGMKSDKDKENTISVEIKAVYDNGLMGYDYTVGSGKDYPYMIMQNNNTDNERGKYITFNNNGRIVLWDKDLGVSKGYYTYSFNNNKRTSLFYKSEMNNGNKDNISNISLSSNGYISNYGVLNPKMISVDTMKCSNNKFSFSSITPKVRVSEHTRLVNGAVINLTLSGIDLTDLKNEGNEKNPEYYLYVDTWNNETLAKESKFSSVVRPRERIRIDNNNPTKTLLTVLDGVKSIPSDDSYYFNVYAYMYKNGKYELIQLFDEEVRDKYLVNTYSFKTKNGESLYNSREVYYQVDDTVYGNRILNTKINLTKYQNNYPYNFDLMYMICEDNNCTKDGGYIFKKEIKREDVSSAIVSQEDISKYDLEYNKNYYIYVYAVASLYEKENNSYVSKEQYINLISSRDIKFMLTALREPSFVVTRKAMYDNGNYYIDFTVNVNDLDRTLVDGKYHVQLLDTDGKTAGRLQVMDDDGNYIDIDNYDSYDFDALVLNKKMRIVGLERDTKYSVVVSSMAYVNNYSEDISKDNRTYEVKKSHAIYTTDNYGNTFGHDISYVITDNSYIALFRSGTNFDNVVRVNYSVSLDDEFNPGVIISGTDEIGNDHKFEFNDESGYGMYVINRNDGIKNTLNKYYLITLSFDVRNPDNKEDIITLTAAYNSKFTDSVAYVKDMDKNK